MFQDYDRLYLGGTPVDTHGAILWTRDEFGFDADEISPQDFNIDWSLSTDEEEFTLRTGGESGSRLLTASTIRGQSAGDHLRIHGSASFDDGIDDVHLDDDIIRLSDFGDQDDRLEFRRSSGDWDQIMFLDRHGGADYDLQLVQDGDEERVFTTADDGSFDAATLEGEDGNFYTANSRDEFVGGEWTFNETIDTDISGNAATADHASNADQLDGSGSSAYAEINENETIFGAWTFDQTPTADGEDVLTEATEYYPDVENDGDVVDTDVGVFDFGNDLGVTDTAEGVQVNFVGATIPAKIYEDGTEILEDANGLDFIGSFDVQAGTDDVAEVELVVPEDLAETSVDENVTGDWTFDANTEFLGRVDIERSDTHIALTNPSTDTTFETTVDGEAYRLGQNGSYYLTVDGDGTDATTLLEDGNRVATRDWSDDRYAEVDGNETITGDWRIGTDTLFEFGDGGEYRWRYSDMSSDLILESSEGGTSTVARANDDGLNISGILEESGDRVATREWVNDDEYASYSSDETISGEWEFSNGVDVDGSVYASEGFSTFASSGDRGLNINRSSGATNPDGDTGFLYDRPAIELHRGTNSDSRGVTVKMGNQDKSWYLFGTQEEFQIRNDDHDTVVEMDQGGDVEMSDDLSVSGAIEEDGGRVATRSWTENNASVPHADDADTWDGYEILFDGESASGSQWIRFETE